MSSGDTSLLTDTKSLALEVKNVSAQIIRKLTTESVSARTLLDRNDTFSHSGVANNNFNLSTKDFDIFKTNDIISDSVNEILDKPKDIHLEDISTTTFKFLNDTIPEVRVSRPEVPEETGLGTPEFVVIGACILVLVLAILAIVLRIVMPIVRPKLKQKSDLIDDDSSDRKSR